MANTTQPLNLTFPKRVGGPAVRADVGELIHRVIDSVAPELDLSENTLEVHFTNDRNLSSPAHLSTPWKVVHQTQQGGYVDAEAASTLGVGLSGNLPHMKVNLQGVKAADYDGLTPHTANHIIHETLHYIQYATGVMSGKQTLKGYGRRAVRRIITTWNHGPAMALNHAIMAAAGRNLTTDASTSDESTDYDRSSVAYAEMPWELQAWRGAYLLGRAMGFPACETARTDYKDFMKKRAARLSRRFRRR